MFNQLMVIPNAIFVPAVERAPLDQPMILAAGRFETEKGFDRLVDAFSRISGKYPEWKLCICGSGTQEGRLKEQIERMDLSDRVILPGSVSNIQDYYRNASIFALSSRAEGLALVLLEAIAFGLPVVSFDLPSTKEVLENGGFIAAQDDIASFAEKLELLISDPALRSTMGSEAFETAKKYTIPTVSARWMQMFNKLLSQ
jgi:glycosyltransferase involved in cell wall biosynthesis